jgi:hypothetical protein
MPERKTLEHARADKRADKAASTQAGEFVREEMEHIREGKHGARSTKQAIAIGLSKARRAGVDLKPPAPGKTSEETRKSAARDLARGQGAPPRRPNAKRSRATEHALQRESRAAASAAALSRQAHDAAERRTPSDRSASARRAAQTKGAAGRVAAARKAAQTRASHA